MELDLTRTIITPQSIIGKLAIDGVFECYTLERSYEDPEFFPIPFGTYPVNIRWSDRFQQNMPHIDNVPNRTAIEIHWGNYVKDTEGCVIVGATKSDNAVWYSQNTFKVLFPKLQASKNPITIKVKETT